MKIVPVWPTARDGAGVLRIDQIARILAKRWGGLPVRVLEQVPVMIHPLVATGEEPEARDQARRQDRHFGARGGVAEVFPLALGGEFDPELEPDRRLGIKELEDHVLEVAVLEHDDEVVNQILACAVWWRLRLKLWAMKSSCSNASSTAIRARLSILRSPGVLEWARRGGPGAGVARPARKRLRRTPGRRPRCPCGCSR